MKQHYDWTIQQCLDKTKEIEKDPKNQAGDGLLKKSAWHKIQDLSFAVSMKMAEGGKA